MTSKIVQFTIEARHLSEGFTGEDISAYAGIPVSIAYHDDFPFSRELRTQPRLSRVQKRIRRAAFQQSADPFCREFYKAADNESCHCLSRSLATRFSLLAHDQGTAWNPYDPDRLYLLRGQDDRPDRWVVVPRDPEADLKKWLTPPVGKRSFTRPQLIHRGLLVLDPENEAPQEHWACAAHLPVEEITNAPPTLISRRTYVAHETRHLIQLWPVLGDEIPPPADDVELYSEYDADMCMRHTMARELPGLGIDPAPHLYIHLMERYASMLTSNQEYRIAPMIELTERGGDFTRAQPAIDEVCARILQKDGAEIFDTKYDFDIVSDECSEDPYRVYSLLRRCVDDGAFAPAPLANHIANRILEGVEFFSEGISRDPQIVNKIYPARQGLVR